MESSSDLLEIKNRILVLENKVKTIENLLDQNPEKKKIKSVSLSEFIIEKKPFGDIQRTLIIGYYLENYKNYNSFNVKDLESGFKDAREKAPKNISLNIFMNAKKGYFIELEKKDGMKAYGLSNSGIRFIENGFKKDE